MNKHIKRKKQIKMYKREFTKEQLLFQKQFPYLFFICDFEFNEITRLHIKKVYNRVIKYSTLKKDEFQTSLKMILWILHENSHMGVLARHYFELYTKLGIMFKDNQGNIKLKCI